MPKNPQWHSDQTTQQYIQNSPVSDRHKLTESHLSLFLLGLTSLQACDLTSHVPSFPVSSLPSPCSGLVLKELCPTLCNAVVYSPPGSFVYGIFQARIL